MPDNGVYIEDKGGKNVGFEGGATTDGILREGDVSERLSRCVRRRSEGEAKVRVPILGSERNPFIV
jgi:hypothetical protein